MSRAIDMPTFFFSRRRPHTRWPRDWSSDVCSSDLPASWAEAFAAIKDEVGKTAPGRIGAIAGDLAAVEEIYALRLLMAARGSKNIDCRQDGAALDPSLGRASYIFNPTIEGIEQADAVLIIGANPRFD